MVYIYFLASSYTDFFYKKNAQNDIIGIYSMDGTQIARYTYDAWGNQRVEYLDNNAKFVAIEDDFMYNQLHLHLQPYLFQPE